MCTTQFDNDDFRTFLKWYWKCCHHRQKTHSYSNITRSLVFLIWWLISLEESFVSIYSHEWSTLRAIGDWRFRHTPLGSTLFKNHFLLRIIEIRKVHCRQVVNANFRIERYARQMTFNIELVRLNFGYLGRVIFKTLYRNTIPKGHPERNQPVEMSHTSRAFQRGFNHQNRTTH